MNKEEMAQSFRLAAEASALYFQMSYNAAIALGLPANVSLEFAKLMMVILSQQQQKPTDDRIEKLMLQMTQGAKSQ